MATGKSSIVINSDELIQGMTTSSNLSDGGFSPETDAINLLANPGVLYPPPTATTIGTLDGNVVASCYDTVGTNVTGGDVDKYILTDNGSLYTLIGGALARAGATIISSSLMKLGVSDMQIYGVDGSGNPIIWITYRNNSGQIGSGISYVYSSGVATAAYAINPQISGSDATSKREVPHPMLVFNKLLFIADGNYLHTVNVTSVTAQVLSLQSEYTITALQVDPGTGRIMLGISGRGYVSVGDFTTQINAPSWIGLYDGTNPTQLLRKVPVDNTVTSFLPCGGYMYVFYGDCFGIWNGNGITFLRRRYTNPIGGQQGNVYKCKSTNIDNVLFYVSNNQQGNIGLSTAMFQIIGYGEILKGTKAFFPIVDLPNNTLNYIDFVSNVGNSSLIFSQNKILYSIYIPQKPTGVFSTGDTSPIFVSKQYSFPRQCTINEVRIFYQDMVASSAGTIGNVGIISDKQSIEFNQDVSNPSAVQAVGYLPVFPNVITTNFQVKYWWKETSTCHGIQKIIVFYTPFE